jgi:hypothetical protein
MKITGVSFGGKWNVCFHGDEGMIPARLGPDVASFLHEISRDAWEAEIPVGADGSWSAQDPDARPIPNAPHDD